MKTPSSLEWILEQPATVEERIESLRRVLSRLRQSQPEADLQHLEATLALLIESQDLLHARAEGQEARWRAPPPRATPRLGALPNEDAGASEVSLGDPDSTRKWCSVLGCGEVDLIQAVWRAGPRVADVADYVARKVDRARGTYMSPA